MTMTESRQDRESATTTSAAVEDLTGPFQQVLELRQRTEKQLADAGEIRSAALEDASGILSAARDVADLHEDAAQRQVEQVLLEARERAAGIVATATEQAGQLRAQAEKDAEKALEEARLAAEDLMVQMREENTQKLVGDIAGLRERIASLSGAADLVLESLHRGLEDAECVVADVEAMAPASVGTSDPADLLAQVPVASANAPEEIEIGRSVEVDPESDAARDSGVSGVSGVSEVEVAADVAGDTVLLGHEPAEPQATDARPLGWLFRTS